MSGRTPLGGPEQYDMTVVDPQSALTKPKLRWYQFTLRALLGIMLINAMFWGWVASQLPRYRAEKHALASLASLLKAPVGYTRIEGPSGLAYVSRVFLRNCTIEDDQIGVVIAELRKLPRLNTVLTDSLKISETGLARLRDALPHVSFGFNSGARPGGEMLPNNDQPQGPPSADQPGG